MVSTDSLTKNLEQYFVNEQTDFFAYMVDQQLFKNKKTYHDYLSRLRYLSGLYKLDKSITEEDVKFIMSDLRVTMSQRTRYNTLKGITDIGSGLKRFMEYAHSDYRKKLDDSVLAEEDKIKNDTKLTVTERQAIVKSRIGQGLFRQRLIDYWHGCSVTQCSTYPLLMASHIRPWHKSDNNQRLDVYNGLLLTPNLDKLFDKGYISFSDEGRIICSASLPLRERKIFAIDDTVHLIRMEDAHKSYLEYHRNYCLL